MGRSIRIIGVVLSLMVYLPIVIGYDINLGGEPSYSLLIETSNTQLNHGDSFKIELSLAGLGEVETSNILVLIPSNLPKDKKVKFTEIDFMQTSNNTYRPMTTVTDKPPRFWFMVPNEYYELISINSINFSANHVLSGASPLSIAQARYTVGNYDYALYTIDCVIADDAPGGDNEIPITYNYKSKGKWYQDKEYIKIHVNRFYETDTFFLIASLLTILSFIALIMQIGRGLSKLGKTNKTLSYLSIVLIFLIAVLAIWQFWGERKMDADTIRTYAEIGTAVGTFALALATFKFAADASRQAKRDRIPKRWTC